MNWFYSRYPWGEEAFTKSRNENKPIFLSVGYSTCHWCHVMERESFESETVAKVLNEHFVSVKVDREERPDVDKVYMTFVQVRTMNCMNILLGEAHSYNSLIHAHFSVCLYVIPIYT